MYSARNAVDRNPSTCMRTNNVGPNSPDKTVWWKVDLGEMSEFTVLPFCLGPTVTTI